MTTETLDLLLATRLALNIGAQEHHVQSIRFDWEPIAKNSNNGGTLAAEEDIARFVRSLRTAPYPGNVAVGIMFYRSNRHRIDVDNLIKTVLDGLTKSKVFWADDSQVTAVAGRLEYDPRWPRTAVCVAPHESTMLRGDDGLTHECEACGAAYRPHSTRQASRFCSRACRPRRVLVCTSCGGPTSAPQVRLCIACYRARGGAR